MSMQTPLRRVKGLGTTRSGTHHFWAQRLTSVANIALTLFVVLSLALHVGADYSTLRAYFSLPFVSIAFLLFIFSSIYHMYLGMQIIIEDYVSSHGVKLVVLMLNIFFSIATGVGSLFAVIKLSLGG